MERPDRPKSPTPDLDRLLAGDREAWEAFEKDFGPVIFRTARNTLAAHLGNPDPADVQEVVQDVFVRLIKDNYRLLRTHDSRRAGLPTWLRSIAKCMAVDFCRRSGPITLSMEDEQAVVRGGAGDGSLEFPEGILSPREESILRLLVEEGLSPAEVAAKMEISVRTVYVHKCKAINKIRDFYTSKARA